jgi:p-cumate 2,3-dioxygenase beta subunit
MSASTPLRQVSSSAALSRAECEDFLYDEAALLDAWRLDDWLKLFVEGATYEVPPSGALDSVESSKTLFYVADDYHRLCHRVERLKKDAAHSEYPRSNGLRLISNVRVLAVGENGTPVRCAFVTYRSKNDVTDTYYGHHSYILRRVADAIRIVTKRTQLDMSSLRPQGRVSIIL